MGWKGLGAVCAVAAALLAGATAARAECTLSVTNLPVTMDGLQPITAAKVNGTEVRLLVDSGAFFNSLSRGGAAELGLARGPLPFGVFVQGVGGGANASVARIARFGLAGSELKDVDFLVVGGEYGPGVAGLLGQNLLGAGDVDYDLAGGMVKLVSPRGCERTNLAYWAAGKAVNIVAIEPKTPAAPHTIADVLVNGVRVRALFDTGAANSTLGLRAARWAGIPTDGAGVRPGGYISGVGRRMVQSWIAPVKSFQIGDETVKNTSLRIGDIGDEDVGMLVGADFFLAHHVYVANSQRRMYFTYNGGPVFDLSVHDAERQTAPSTPAKTAAAGPDEPADADGYSRRGAARLARGDAAGALTDFDRACALAPKDARYLEQRAQANLALHQTERALADLDAALKLGPGDGRALFLRAVLRLQSHDRTGARADLDAASATALKPADLRLELATAYTDLDAFAPAVAEFDLWLAAHPEDARRAEALNGRCWARALAGRDLDAALSDCDVSVRLGGRRAEVLDSRGLVHLRRGEWEKAIADYDAALALDPSLAWSLYGRGVAEARTGQTDKSRADLAAAALAPEVRERAATLGIGEPRQAPAPLPTR